VPLALALEAVLGEEGGGPSRREAMLGSCAGAAVAVG
jgi:hypothetical protein